MASGSPTIQRHADFSLIWITSEWAMIPSEVRALRLRHRNYRLALRHENVIAGGI